MSNFGRFRTASRARGRSGSGRSRLGRPIRPFEWVPFIVPDTLLPTLTIVSINLVPAPVITEMNSPTVMRFRALMTLRAGDPPVPGVTSLVVGAQVVDEDDLTLHSPFGHGDSSDWFLWQPILFSTEPDSASIGSQGLFVDLDSKSRRRLGPRGHMLNLYIHNLGPSGVNYSIAGRILFKS